MTEYRRQAAFTLACAGMLVFGVVLTSLGAVLPEITERFGVTKAAAGCDWGGSGVWNEIDSPRALAAASVERRPRACIH